MRILFLSQRAPFPPNKGDKIRSFNIIKHLSKEHSISLLSLADDIRDLGYAGELKAYCASVDIIYLNRFFAKIRSLLCLFLNRPLTLGYFYSAKLMRLAQEKLKKEKFDLIFIYSSSMAQYALNVNGIPKIIDFIDVDSDKWRQYAEHTTLIKRLIYRIEQSRLREYEIKIASSVAHCLVTSEPEAELFQTFIGHNRFSVLSNGVDYEYFKPNSHAKNKSRLVFVGQMDYFANVDGMKYFCKEILPLIKESVPGIELYIVGSKPAKEIYRLAGKHIVVTGAVEDIRPYVQGATLCVVPLRIARGIQNKILEAMAMGVPVVATPEAAKGICAGREDIFTESEPKKFAARVIELLGDKGLRSRISANARGTIEDRYSWDKNLSKVDEILDEIVK